MSVAQDAYETHRPCLSAANLAGGACNCAETVGPMLGTFASAEAQGGFGSSLTMADVQRAVNEINALNPSRWDQPPGPADTYRLGFSGFAQVIEDPNMPLGQILWAGNLAVAPPSMAFRLDNIAPFIPDLTPPPPIPEDPPTYLRKRVLRGK